MLIGSDKSNKEGMQVTFLEGADAGISRNGYGIVSTVDSAKRDETEFLRLRRMLVERTGCVLIDIDVYPCPDGMRWGLSG